MKELYTELQDKHSLPPYKQMDEEFELSGIENEEHYLRNVRRKMVEKIDKVIGILDDILHPESSWASMVEEKVFPEEQGKKVLATYRRLKYYYRRNSELQVKDSDEENTKFINDLYAEWQGMQNEILAIVSKLKDAWTQELTTKEKVGYLG